MVTNIVQNHFGDSLEQLPGNYTSYKEIDSKCNSLTVKYKGKTVNELVNELNIDATISNSISEQIVVRMFGGKSKKISKIELFNKIGFICKTITLTKKGGRTEDMKLFTIDFEEWTDKDTAFEDSVIYDYFANNQFLCTIFEEPSGKAGLADNRFIGFKRLAFSDEFIQNVVRKIWVEIRDLITENKLREKVVCNKKNKPIINKNGTIKRSINFPKAKDNIVFVKGTGQDSNDKSIQINGINMYRQNIWLKGSYVVEVLKNIPIL